MAYNITVGFSNGIVQSFTGITKIEKMSCMYGELVWTEVENPLKLNFDIFGDYRFSNESTASVIHTLESSFTNENPYSLGIVFMEIKKADVKKVDVRKAEN
ncbi:MAG: hypothetical protein NC177_06405 [Ruminococcus flavefaciens]|nr:hypothetical protein [Ruminococcus flavefaciens]